MLGATDPPEHRITCRGHRPRTSANSSPGVTSARCLSPPMIGREGRNGLRSYGDAHPPRLADVSGAGRPDLRRLRRAMEGRCATGAKLGVRSWQPRRGGTARHRRGDAAPERGALPRPAGPPPALARRARHRARPGVAMSDGSRGLGATASSPARGGRVAVSRSGSWELESKVRSARKVEVVGCGVASGCSDSTGACWMPAFVCVSSLTERTRSAGARVRAARRGLTFVGDGPLRPLEGPVLFPSPDASARRGAAGLRHVVCRPLVEPFSRCSGIRRASVVATQVGGRRVRDARFGAVDPTSRSSILGAPPRRRAAVLERRRPRGRGGARRQAAGREGGGDSPASRSRPASLTSTSGRICSSSPASRATSSACS